MRAADLRGPNVVWAVGHQGLNQGLVGDSNGHDAKLLHALGNLHCMLRLLAVLQGANPSVGGGNKSNGFYAMLLYFLENLFETK